MRCDQSGPIIQVKGNGSELNSIQTAKPLTSESKQDRTAFYSSECCTRALICEYTGKKIAERCSDHNKQFMKWKRIKKTRTKFKKNFKKDRHKFIKMLTFGLPGDKTTTNKKTQWIPYKGQELEVNQDHKIWRSELRSRFNKLRRDKWWKKHVDGGIWFYETVLTDLDSKNQMNFDEQVSEMNDIRMKIHPHFHCMILGPKNLAGPERNFQELNNLFEKHGLGKPSVSVARSKSGNAINASLNKSLWYLTNYLKKQDHAEGINRGSFGIFNRRG